MQDDKTKTVRRRGRDESLPDAGLAEWAGDRLHRLVLFEEGDHNDIQWTNAGAYQTALMDFMNVLGREE